MNELNSTTDDTKKVDPVIKETLEEKKESRLINLAILPSGGSVIPMKWEIESMEWNAKQAFMGRMLPKTLLEGRTAQEAYQAALTIIGRGREVGIPPMASLERIKWINNTPTMDAEAKWGIVINQINTLYKEYKKQGLSEEEIEKIIPHLDVVEHTNTRCVIRGNRPPMFKNMQTYEWTIEMAQNITVMEKNKEIKLSEKQVWKNYAHDMLLSRGKSLFCRQVWPDVTMGISYTEEEAESFTPEDIPNYKTNAILTESIDFIKPPKPPQTDDIDFSPPKPEPKKEEPKKEETTLPKRPNPEQKKEEPEPNIKIEGIIAKQLKTKLYFRPKDTDLEYILPITICVIQDIGNGKTILEVLESEWKKLTPMKVSEKDRMILNDDLKPDIIKGVKKPIFDDL